MVALVAAQVGGVAERVRTSSVGQSPQAEVDMRRREVFSTRKARRSPIESDRPDEPERAKKPTDSPNLGDKVRLGEHGPSPRLSAWEVAAPQFSRGGKGAGSMERRFATSHGGSAPVTERLPPSPLPEPNLLRDRPPRRER